MSTVSRRGGGSVKWQDSRHKDENNKIFIYLNSIFSPNRFVTAHKVATWGQQKHAHKFTKMTGLTDFGSYIKIITIKCVNIIA